MEIPYTSSTRPDTGLWNAKIGIWLFLASEVMLFGALFSAYIFLRIDAAPGTWPHGLLNVPVGTGHTAILIVSSVTVVLAWAALKVRRYRLYWWYRLATLSGGVLVFIYMWLPVSKRLYQRNPEHLANRVEVSGLFWHFVDLIWIFVFPLFYLL